MCKPSFIETIHRLRSRRAPPYRAWLLTIACFLLTSAGCTSGLATGDEAQGPATSGTMGSNPDWLLMVIEGDGDLGLQLNRVDPETLEPDTTTDPIDLGHYYDHAISPDGKTVAFLTWLHPMPNRPTPASLRLLDVESWEQTGFEVEVARHAARLRFAADGSSLFWVAPSDRSEPHGVPRSWRLNAFLLEGEELADVVEFDEEFSPSEVAVLPNGEVAVYGIHVDHRNVRTDPPAVHVVDVDDGSIRESVDLPDLDAGQVELGDPEHVAGFEQRRPGLAWDRTNQLLYIAHPSADRVTTVDLGAGEIRDDSEINRRLSFLERLVAAVAGSAKAKMVPTTSAYAALDPAGDYLYVSGTVSDPVVEGDDQIDWDYEYGDLRMVSVESIEEVARFGAGDVGSIVLTPDGSRILAHRFEPEEPADERTISLAILDAGDLEEQVTLEIGPGFEIAGFSPDGNLAYVVHWDEDADEATRIVRIIDVESGEQINELRFPGHFGPQFLGPGPR